MAAPGAPNGIDERLSVDMIGQRKTLERNGCRWHSRRFPRSSTTRTAAASARLLPAIHLLDSLIALESLYRYLRKFHALGDRRYAVISMTQLVQLVVVLLSLEFMPRRRHL